MESIASAKSICNASREFEAIGVKVSQIPKASQKPKVYLSYIMDTKDKASGEVVSVMVEGVEDTLTQAEIEISYDPKVVQVENVVLPKLLDENLSVFTGAGIDNTQGKLSVKALVVNKEQLISTSTEDSQQLSEGYRGYPQLQSIMRDIIDEEENIAPIAHIMLKKKHLLKSIRDRGS